MPFSMPPSYNKWIRGGEDEKGYRITIENCSLFVGVHYLPPKEGLVGPAQFELEPGELNCSTIKQ